MRVLICGDRNWTNKPLIKSLIKALQAQYGDDLWIIEGEARGADKLAREAAEELLVPVLRFPADWATYGKAAGHIRNRQMITEGKPGVAFAFHNDIRNSKGTADMVRALQAHKIPVTIVTSERFPWTTPTSILPDIVRDSTTLEPSRSSPKS